jgi:hypothetical protein
VWNNLHISWVPVVEQLTHLVSACCGTTYTCLECLLCNNLHISWVPCVEQLTHVLSACCVTTYTSREYLLIGSRNAWSHITPPTCRRSYTCGTPKQATIFKEIAFSTRNCTELECLMRPKLFVLYSWAFQAYQRLNFNDISSLTEPLFKFLVFVIESKGSVLHFVQVDGMLLLT